MLFFHTNAVNLVIKDGGISAVHASDQFPEAPKYFDHVELAVLGDAEMQIASSPLNLTSVGDRDLRIPSKVDWELIFISFRNRRLISLKIKLFDGDERLAIYRTVPIRCISIRPTQYIHRSEEQRNIIAIRWKYFGYSYLLEKKYYS